MIKGAYESPFYFAFTSANTHNPLMQRIATAFIIIAIAMVSGWQYALLRNFPIAEAISDIIPSPDQQVYATVIHYRSRMPFRPVQDYVAIEVGRGIFDEDPEVIHSVKRPLHEVNLKALGQRRAEELIIWKPDSSQVRVHLDGEPMIFNVQTINTPSLEKQTGI